MPTCLRSDSSSLFSHFLQTEFSSALWARKGNGLVYPLFFTAFPGATRLYPALPCVKKQSAHGAANRTHPFPCRVHAQQGGDRGEEIGNPQGVGNNCLPLRVRSESQAVEVERRSRTGKFHGLVSRSEALKIRSMIRQEFAAVDERPKEVLVGLFGGGASAGLLGHEAYRIVGRLFSECLGIQGFDGKCFPPAYLPVPHARNFGNKLVGKRRFLFPGVTR